MNANPAALLALYSMLMETIAALENRIAELEKAE